LIFSADFPRGEIDMRLRHIALGCALTGGLGFLALPTGPALAGNTVLAGNTGLARDTVPARDTGLAARDAKPEISVSSPETDNPFGAKITLTVTLKPAVAGRAVALYATPSGGPRALVATGTVDAEGKWYAPYSITRATAFTAVFAGDAHHAPVSASRTFSAYARVTGRLGGAYATNQGRDGIAYAVFHAAGTLTLYSTVAPDKRGECLEPESEQYDKGAGWDADSKYGCDKLDRDSHDTAPFSLSLAAGDRYRIRGDYLRGKDTANLSTTGPWLYFIVAK
jgi:hypothetical protein